MNTTEYAELASDMERLAAKILKKHKLSREDGEEVTQDALIELTRCLDQGFVEVPGALFRVILEKNILQRIKANRRRAKVEQPVGGRADLANIEMKRLADGKADFAAVHPSKPRTPDEQLFVTAFNQTLPTLPEPARTAFVLVDVRGLSFYEAGLELGLTKTGAQWHVEAARAQLRAALA